MKKKVIGISCNIVKAKDSDSFPGLYLQRIFNEYIQAVILAGAVPILIPVTNSTVVLDRQLDLIDGLIVSGGYDVNPDRYNEEPHRLLGNTSHSRDDFEFYLVEQAYKRHIPYLGICRGHQVLNVAFGGTLYQDLSLKDDTYIKHSQKSDPHKPCHSIKVSPNSNLFNIFGETYKVNSFHHQGVKDVAKGFLVSATSPDGIVEGIELIDNENFLMGVQWHPEIMAEDDNKTLELFKYFIKHC